MYLSQKVFASGTSLSAGDIYIVTANTNPDFFEFLVRKDLDTNTEIHFSDNAWKEDDTRRTGEGTITFTSTTTIPAGTVISIENPHTSTPTIIQNTLGTVSRNGNFDLAG